jgi:Zn-dependent peptidase ImmA (M78 family)
MARFIPDPVSGLPWRPYKSEDEIDIECESLLRQFLNLSLETPFPHPLTTDLLTVIIEAYAERLDLYADMAANVEGLTTISATTRPSVHINRHLSMAPARINRFRSTLAHELYHLVFHAPYYQERARQGDLFRKEAAEIVCTRGTILGAKKVDWREWQAAYGAGAMLMPGTALQHVIRGHSDIYGLPPYMEESQAADAVIVLVATRFEVSREAATVRLWQKGFLRAVADGQQFTLLGG